MKTSLTLCKGLLGVLCFLSLLLLTTPSAAHGAESTTPMKTHIAFGGGGIRAQFGSVIAACELSKSIRNTPPDQWPIDIKEFVGLSGGAWGSVTLANIGR